jgi:WhiB family redox-sensing transcriptional regulator
LEADVNHRVLTHQAPPTDRGTDWRDLGACRQFDAEIWFPDGDGPRYADRVEQAKRVCLACPVMETCRQWALEQREPHGVWGGLSARERQAILRRRGHRPAQFRGVRVA